MQDQTKAYYYAGAAILAWSTVASAFKLSLRELSPVELLLFSSLASTLVLTVVLIFRGGASLRTWKRSDFLISALMGFLNPFLYYMVLFRAYDLLPAQEAQPLNYAWPIVLVVLSALVLRQSISSKVFLAMLVSLAGVAVISTRGDILGMQFTNKTGVALALISTLIWASYWLVNIRDKKDPVLRLLVNFLFGSTFILIYVAIFESFRLPSVSGLLGAAYVGIFEMGLTFVFWLNALRLSKTTAQVSGLIFLAPFLSLLAIHFVVGEDILPSTLVGLALIVGGIVLQRFFMAQGQKKIA